MGMHFKDIKYFEEVTEFLQYKKLIKDFKELRLLILGDLFIRADLHNYMRQRLASQYFKNKGFDVSVIDLDIGKESTTADVLKYDLSKPIDTSIGVFDFIIDFGTAEHIENQYELFRNIHNLCRDNGVIIMSNPSDRYCEGYPEKHHGLFHYTSAFYIELAALCNYVIMDIREMAQKYWIGRMPNRKNFTYVTMIKKEINVFPSFDKFKDIAIELGDYRK